MTEELYQCDTCHKIINEGQAYDVTPTDKEDVFLVEHPLCGLRRDAKHLLKCENCTLPICWVADILEHRQDCELIPLCFNCKPMT